MKVILDQYPSHVSVGPIRGENLDQTEALLPPPKVHVITGTLVYQPDEVCQMAEFKTLLDTGCDVTVVSTDMVGELGKRGGADLHPERKIEIGGALRPVYDLAFVLPGGHRCVSPYGGFAALPSDLGTLDLTNMLLGLDVLNQFIVTFDGLNGTVTICEL